MALSLNKAAKVQINPKSECSVAVVTHTDGSALDLYDTSTVFPDLDVKFLVPSPADLISRSPIQRVYLFDKNQ